MDSKAKPRFSITPAQVGGVRRTVIRLACTYDGETHVYEYPPEEASAAAQVIALHVNEGQLHPYAGGVLVRMVFAGMKDD